MVVKHYEDANPHERCGVCGRWTWCGGWPAGEPRPAGCDSDEKGRRESDKAAHPWYP